jgi:RNA polymerase sigma-70 factor (ECF subfamily)
MTELGDRFEEHRPRLRAVAYRMLGSPSEADDAVQEAWLRLGRSDADEIDNLDAWLTTVVARIALNMLCSRRTRREEPLDDGLLTEPADGLDPEEEAVLADSVGLALLVVLETLTPAERLEFVLHDMFSVPFGEIARIIERSPEAARQLASRARRRVRGAIPPADPDPESQRVVVDAFVAAAHEGDFDALIAVLDPDVVLRAETGDGAFVDVQGAEAVARQARMYSQLGLVVRPAIVNGTAGWASLQEGRLFSVGAALARNGRIVALYFISGRENLDRLKVEIL